MKTRFAQLFCIQDRSVVEQIFSGETVILRSDLDRKSAAEYFREISQLGGQAELVVSTKRHAEPGQVAVKLEQESAGPPRLIREAAPSFGMDREILIKDKVSTTQSWPVSSARIHRERDKIRQQEQAAARQQALQKEAAAEEARQQAALEEAAAEEQRQHSLQARQAAEAAMQRQRAAEEAARQEQLEARETARKQAIEESRRQQAEERAAQQALQEKKLARIRTMAEKSQDLAEQEIAELERLEAETLQKTAQEINDLQDMCRTARESAGKEIARLQ